MSYSLQSYHFLDLLQVLCVCDGVAIPNNQSYIVQKWLRTYKVSESITIQYSVELPYFLNSE